jgi:hypothetical protein
MIYFYLLAVLAIMVLSVHVANKKIPLEIAAVKYPEIDGLRGYLAFFVFLHHSYIWHDYLKTKQWGEPKSNFFLDNQVLLYFL